MLRSLWEFLVVLCHPSVWVMTMEYNYPWDLRFRYLLETEKFKIDRYNEGSINKYNAWLGPERLWVENLPYGAFYNSRNSRPSRYACIKGAQKVRKLFADYYLAQRLDGVYKKSPGEWEAPHQVISQITEIKADTEILVSKLVNKRKRRK